MQECSVRDSLKNLNKYEGIIRSSFLIDVDGRIIQAWYKVSRKDTVPNELKVLQGKHK